MSIFTDAEAELVAFAKQEWTNAKAFITKEELAIAPIAVADLEALWSATKKIAVAVVIEFAKDEFAAMSGQEKQSEVMANVKATAVSMGLATTSAMEQTIAQQAFALVATAIEGK